MQRFCRSKICSAFGDEAILRSRALILQKTKQIEIQIRALCQESGKSFLAPKIAKELSANGRRRIFEFSAALLDLFPHVTALSSLPKISPKFSNLVTFEKRKGKTRRTEREGLLRQFCAREKEVKSLLRRFVPISSHAGLLPCSHFRKWNT